MASAVLIPEAPTVLIAVAEGLGAEVRILPRAQRRVSGRPRRGLSLELRLNLWISFLSGHALKRQSEAASEAEAPTPHLAVDCLTTSKSSAWSARRPPSP
jgi:hypothetical protein